MTSNEGDLTSHLALSLSCDKVKAFFYRRRPPFFGGRKQTASREASHSTLSTLSLYLLYEFEILVLFVWHDVHVLPENVLPAANVSGKVTIHFVDVLVVSEEGHFMALFII